MTIGELKSLIRSLVGDAINYTPNSTVSFSAQTYSDTQLDAAIFHAFKIYANFTDSLYKEYTGQIRVAFVYGSVAKGSEGPHSDSVS